MILSIVDFTATLTGLGLRYISKTIHFKVLSIFTSLCFIYGIVISFSIGNEFV